MRFAVHRTINLSRLPEGMPNCVRESSPARIFLWKISQKVFQVKNQTAQGLRKATQTTPATFSETENTTPGQAAGASVFIVPLACTSSFLFLTAGHRLSVCPTLPRIAGRGFCVWYALTHAEGHSPADVRGGQLSLYSN